MTDKDRRNALGALFIATAAGAIGVNNASASRAHQTASHPSNSDKLNQLIAKDEIQEVLFDYARGNDRMDEAMIRNCFWPESTHKHGRFDGTSMNFIGFAVNVLSALKYTSHHISNVSIKVNGNRAFSECYYFAHHRRVAAAGGEEDAFFQGRYLDFFENRNGVWKIIRRRGISDYSPPAIPAAVLYADWPAGTHGLRNNEDEYYNMLNQFNQAPR